MITNRLGLAFLLVLALSTSAWAQGSVFGTVTNANATTPANGEISFVGYLDDTDEEIRIESCDGAGYDVGNWFDDFQNYLTEAPGNPYDYHFYNSANGEGVILSGGIPNNSFQQENVALAVVGWPVAPQGLSAVSASSSTMLLSWTAVPGLTYHVYRRNGASNGSFFRIDDPSGSLANPGVAEGLFVDNTVDGVSTYDYAVIAEDPSGSLSPHSGVVGAGSAAPDAPVVATIDPAVGTSLGGTLVNVYGSGFDPAGAQVFFGATGVTTTVISPFHLTGATPAGAIGSSVDVSVTNTASGEVSNVLTGAFTYSANASPVLAAIGPQTIAEDAQLTFGTSASDPDATIPILTSSDLPGTATYVDNGDGTGLFDWTPTFTDAGTYSVTFYATDAIVSVAVDSEIVSITVTDGGNQSPIVSVINDTTIVEGQALALQFSASDPDNDPLGLAASDMPTGAIFIDNGDGTGDFTFTPDFTQAGVYDVTFSATDSAFNMSSTVAQITVTNVNQLPVMAAIGPQSTDENVPLSFLITATDIDGVVPVLSSSLLPGTAVLTDSLNGVGLFEWTPDFNESGPYSITFYAADGDFPAEADSEVVVITVNDSGNQTPILAAIGAQTVAEGVNLNVPVSGSDPDGTIPALRAEDLPANATFVDNLDGTGVFDFTPSFVQAGEYTVTFIADDGLVADSEAVVVTVTDYGNVAPTFDPLGDFTVNEADSLFFDVVATDPDGGGVFPVLSVSTSLTNYTFTDNGDGTGSLSYRPDYFNAGIDTVDFFATDSGNPIQTSSVQSIITTVEVNQPPVIDSLPPLAVLVGDSLIVTVTASDSTDPIAANVVLLSALSLPLNASFADNGDGTGTLAFAPDASQEGVSSVSLLAVDQGTPSLSMTMDFDISVVLVNEFPIITPIGPRVVTEGQALTINVSATDPDGPAPALSVSNPPEGAVFTDNGDGTGFLDYTPIFFGEQRLESVTFRAYDGISMSKELVLIQVYDAGNQAPVFDSIPAPTVIEGDSLVQGISAKDPDGNPLTLTIDESVVILPTHSSFLDMGLGLGAITFYPDFMQAGLYDIYIVAWDGPEDDPETLSDTIVVTVEVIEYGNHTPIIVQLPDLVVAEHASIPFTISASDLDLDPITLSTGTLPTNASFVDDGNGIGSFAFDPDYTQAGTYPIEFYAFDGTDTDTMALSIEVTNVNRPPFASTPDNSYRLYETDTLTFDVEGFDLDGTIPTMTAHLSGQDILDPNMSFVDNGDGTGTFQFIPDWDQGGTESIPNQFSVLFRATDEIYTDDYQESEPVVLNVVDRNQPPVLSFPTPGGPGPYTINEGETVQFYVAVIDPDAVTAPTIAAQDVPASNATFTYDAPTGIGQFTFSPDFVQAGTYPITFVATDDRGGVASAIVLIDVLEAGNQPPSFGINPPDTLMVPTGHHYEIEVNPFDPESDSISVEAFPMLPGAVFVQSAGDAWTYGFSADSALLGDIFEITFVVTDYPGLATDTLVTHPRVVAFLRGDVDSDNLYSVNDIAYLVEYLFRNGPSPTIIEAADVNHNGVVTISDLSYLIYYMFKRGPQPPP